MQVEVDPAAEQRLDLPPRGGPDRAQPGTAGAEHDRLLAVPLDVHGRVDHGEVVPPGRLVDRRPPASAAARPGRPPAPPPGSARRSGSRSARRSARCPGRAAGPPAAGRRAGRPAGRPGTSSTADTGTMSASSSPVGSRPAAGRPPAPRPPAAARPGRSWSPRPAPACPAARPARGR